LPVISNFFALQNSCGMLKYLVLTVLLFSFISSFSQAATDSIPAADSLSIADSLKGPIVDTTWWKDSLPSMRRDTIYVPADLTWATDSFSFTEHPFYRFTNPSRYVVSLRQREGKEVLFYAMVGLLFFFAMIRNLFARYLQDMFKIFFRTTVRQRQIKDQLLQSPLPSLLLNIFFLVSVGMFAALAMGQFGLADELNFWLLYSYCILGLMGIYLLKYLVLKFVGWILQVMEVVDTYIFIVFTTNKVMGVLLLPFIIVLALTYGNFSQVSLTAGLFLMGAFFIYRYFLAYTSVHRQLKFTLFHFLLYLLAFEIIPLLLINKLLFTFLT
jgi:hypothetical protein